MWQFIGRTLVVGAALVLGASFAGDLHGVGDSLAVFRTAILLGALVVALLVWRWRMAQGVCVAVVLIGTAQAMDGRMSPAPQAADLVHYQKNLLYFERDRRPFVADVVEANADIVTLQEISPSNEVVLDLLRPYYPYQMLCNARRVRTNAILSRAPLVETDCSVLSGFARAVTSVRGEVVQVYSIHLFWPFPYRQRRQVAELTPLLERENTVRTVIGGDFNMVPWGRSLAAIEQATGTDRVGRAVATYDLYGYPLAIDHILATGGTGSLEARPFLGSDHRGLVARITFP